MNELEKSVYNWVKDIVIGQNLCPYAHVPFNKDTIRIVTQAKDQSDDSFFMKELKLIMATTEKEVATSLAIFPNANVFKDFLIFFNKKIYLLEQTGFYPDYRMILFHPEYQGKETDFNLRENFIYRSPVPLIQFLRGSEMKDITEADGARVKNRNREHLDKLDDKIFEDVFGYLKN